MILTDAHVHIYDCFDLGTFFTSALANFRTEAALRSKGDNFTAFLLLTETSTENWFHRLADYADLRREIRAKNGSLWTVHHTKENLSLWVQCNASQGFFLVAGRQIKTSEDLEILALITDRKFKENRRLEELIKVVKESGAIPVIPWGLGKWTGRRGRILKHALEEANSLELFLGDNGGRPAFWPRPAHFKMAEANGLRILPGSDSLPFASEVRRVGSMGFSVQGPISLEHPGRDLKSILLSQKTLFLTYGNLEHPYRFFRNQLAVRIMKRWQRGK